MTVSNDLYDKYICWTKTVTQGFADAVTRLHGWDHIAWRSADDLLSSLVHQLIPDYENEMLALAELYMLMMSPNIILPCRLLDGIPPIQWHYEPMNIGLDRESTSALSVVSLDITLQDGHLLATWAIEHLLHYRDGTIPRDGVLAHEAYLIPLCSNHLVGCYISAHNLDITITGKWKDPSYGPPNVLGLERLAQVLSHELHTHFTTSGIWCNMIRLGPPHRAQPYTKPLLIRGFYGRCGIISSAYLTITPVQKKVCVVQ
jgi:hypothetical protein